MEDCVCTPAAGDDGTDDAEDVTIARFDEPKFFEIIELLDEHFVAIIALPRIEEEAFFVRKLLFVLIPAPAAALQQSFEVKDKEEERFLQP